MALWDSKKFKNEPSSTEREEQNADIVGESKKNPTTTIPHLLQAHQVAHEIELWRISSALIAGLQLIG